MHYDLNHGDYSKLDIELKYIMVRMKRVSMVNKIIFFIVLASILSCSKTGDEASFVVRDDGKTYIVDKIGQRWDVTQAESIGFKPEKFQYGIGKDTIKPLDDTALSDDNTDVPQTLRIIGVEDGINAQAYSVSTLTRHEISNSTLGSEPIAVGY